jgi:hypothetical protein
MKKQTNYLFILILLIACNEGNSTKYYQNDKIKEERVFELKGDTTYYLSMMYYQNGVLLAKGHVKDGNRIGLWQEWYADGAIKWEGNYENNNRIIELPVKYVKIIFKDSILKKNETSYLRVKVDGIHPNDIILGCTNGIIKNSDTKDLYDFMVIPEHLGKIKFVFFVRQQGKPIPIGKDSLNIVE